MTILLASSPQTFDWVSLIWLICSLPFQFFSSLLYPFAAGIFTLVPFIGTVCFIAGVAMSIVQRKRALLFFLFPSMLSECYYAVLLGRFQGTSSETAFWFPVIFFSVQIALIGYIVTRSKEPARRRWRLLFSH